jgi:hypothetical protein
VGWAEGTGFFCEAAAGRDGRRGGTWCNAGKAGVGGSDAGLGSREGGERGGRLSRRRGGVERALWEGGGVRSGWQTGAGVGGGRDIGVGGE